MSTRAWTNWGGNQTARPRRTLTPTSTAEVAAAVTEAAAAGLAVKPVGTGHSFTAAAVTDGLALRPEGLRRVRSVDTGTGLVTVESGMPLHELCRELASHGLALTNMGDVAVQTVAGAIATGTHGTGRDSGGIAAQVRGLELVLADGSVVTCSETEHPELFAAARVGLGALGVVTAVTLAAEPAFLLHAREDPMRLDAVLDSFDELVAGNDHFEFFWFPHTPSALVKRNNRVPGPPRPLPGWRSALEDEFLANTVYGLLCRAGHAAPRIIRPMNHVAARALSAREYTEASYRVFTSSRRVRFVEMEYAIPRSATVAVLRELRTLVEASDWYLSMPVEVRVAPRDDVWLSTAYGRDTSYLAVHMFHRSEYRPYFDAVESLLAAAGGRPHWGKLHTRDVAALAEAYPRFSDFTAIRDKVDPERRFANPYLRQVLGE